MAGGVARLTANHPRRTTRTRKFENVHAGLRRRTYHGPYVVRSGGRLLRAPAYVLVTSCHPAMGVAVCGCDAHSGDPWCPVAPRRHAATTGCQGCDTRAPVGPTRQRGRLHKCWGATSQTGAPAQHLQRLIPTPFKSVGPFRHAPTTGC